MAALTKPASLELGTKGGQESLAESRDAASSPKSEARGVGPNPCDRAKMGIKTRLLVEGDGGPLSVCIAPANVNDHLLLATTLDSIVVKRPEPTEEELQNLCLDKGYDNEPSRQVVEERSYTPHIRRIGEASCPSLGSGENLLLAGAVAWHFESLGEDTAKLPGESQVGVCLVMDSPSL